MKRKLLNLLLFILLLISLGCSTSTNVETESNWIVPTPNVGKGVVYGQLLNALSGKPVGGMPFLAKNLSYKDLDMPATISFSLQYDPRAIYDKKTGSFYFQGIEPAENYVIVLSYGPGDIYTVRDEGQNYPIMIDVKMDQSIDLGTIPVKEP